MNDLGFLGIAIFGGMLGNLLTNAAFFAIRERRRHQGGPYVERLPRLPNPFVRWWREQ